MLKSPRKPASFIQQEAALSILRAADLIVQQSANVMKAYDLTAAQFNVLRILRGASEGLSCGQISERLTQRDPDITRLLDRMEARNLILRHRSDQDRRVVTTAISQEGLNLLERADPAIHGLHLRQFENFTDVQMHQLIQLMQLIPRQLGCLGP